jgi:hypothetical protein
MNRKVLSLALAIGLAVFILPTLLSFFYQTQIAYAATFNVNTVVDEADGSCADADCSIRDAIALATSGDTISIPPGTYQLSDILGQLSVSKTLLFSGTGSSPADVIIQAGANARLVAVSNGTATFFNMTLQNGAPLSGNGGAINATASGSIVLDTAVLTNNQSIANGGAIALTNGSLSLTNSQILSNTAGNNGGGVFSNNGPVTLINSGILTNTAVNNGGGIVLNLLNANLIMNSGQINGNIASLEQLSFPGGGVYLAQGSMTMNGGEIRGNMAHRGGGILVTSGNLTINSGQIIDNEADYGGGVYVRNLEGTATINGGQITLNRAIDPFEFGGGGLYIFQGLVTQNGGEISFNTALNDGGGMEIGDPGGRFVQMGGEIHNNSAGNMGGGIYNAEGTLAISGGTIHTNLATQGGGGIFTGINSSNTIAHSAILTNTAVTASSGGGLQNSGTLTLTNATLSGNSAANGAGIFNTGTAVLTNVTLSGNSAAGSGGGVRNNSGTLSIGNSIIFGNSAPAGPDCSGTISSAGNNISSCGGGDINSDPLLAPLALNGGSTLNYALSTGSPALDAGSNTLCPSSDQRGNLRPIDGNGDTIATCDVGAYEWGLGFFINDVTLAEGDAGSTQMNFTVSRSFITDTTYSVDYETVNSTAFSGLDFTAISDTLVFLPADMAKTVSVTILGDLLDEEDEQFAVELSNQSAGVQVGDFSGTGTILDDDAPPTLSLNDVAFAESDAGTQTAVFTATLSAQSGKTVTVTFATMNGTAVAGVDYTAASGTFTFTPGDMEESVSITILDDALDEFDEQFTLELSNPVNATLADGSGQATITDDDTEPALSIANTSVTEGNSGTSMANFVVTLSAPSGKPITVNYQTTAVSATAGTDYVSINDTLTFVAGDTTETINVTVNSDTTDESNETFQVNLSGATNATISNGQAIGTIIDDDPPPTATIQNAALPEGDSGTAVMQFTVTLSAASQKIITISYSSANGSATAGEDYTAVSGTLTFNPGNSLSQTINVMIHGDEEMELDELFFINLTSGSNVTLGSSQAAGTISNDDGFFIFLPLIVKP